MPKNWLKGVNSAYDTIIIGSGLGGMTAGNLLAKLGHRVLILEHHYNFGGLATWFKRKGGHILDISLHGFPIGMIKTCRKYWSKEVADSIVRLKNIRFDNPQFSFGTTFDKEDFTQLMRDRFGVLRETVDDFFTTVRGMNFFDDLSMTTRDLFEKFFPGRNDIHRLLMEPITYANGSQSPYCFCDSPDPTGTIVFPAVPLAPTDEIMVILRPAPGALPELPGLPGTDEGGDDSIRGGVPQGCPCDGDANGDGVVDVNDISFVLFRLGDICFPV